MTNGEQQAIMIAEKWTGDSSVSLKLKKLGEELIEFTEAVLTKDDEDVLDEAGDMLFLVLHILKKSGIDDSKINQTQLVLRASEKMEARGHRGYFKSEKSEV